MTSLSEYVERYWSEHDISEGRLEQYRVAARLFDQFSPKTGIEGLDDQKANRWLLFLDNRHRSKRTIAGYRNSLLTLWRAANRSGLCPTEPKHVKRLRLIQPIPEAWTIEEVTALLKAIDRINPHRRCQKYPEVRKRDWWKAFVLVSWDTALRMGDILALHRSDIANGRITIVQSKTGWVHRTYLREETIAAVAVLQPGMGLIFEPWGNRSTICRGFKALVKSAGLTKGTSKWIRRSSATAVEREQPGAAMRHLGHRTPGLAYRHYVDPRQLDDEMPMPPALG